MSRNGCASRFFAVVVSKRRLPLAVGFSGVIFRVRLSHSLVIFVKSCCIPFVLFVSELCIMVSVRSLSLSDLLLSSKPRRRISTYEVATYNICDNTISYLSYQSIELLFVRFMRSILVRRELVPSKVNVINTHRGKCIEVHARLT